MNYTINEIRDKVVPIAKSFGVKSVSLFGSYAKVNANDECDVDIFIEIMATAIPLALDGGLR